MARLPLIQVSDLADFLEVDLDDDDRRAVSVLTVVSNRVRSVTGRTWLDEADELLDVPDEVQGVVLTVAARVYNNPTLTRQETTGPFSRTLDPIASVGFILTMDEQAVLNRYRPKHNGLFVLGSYRGDLDGSDTVWVTTLPEPSGQGFPFISTLDD